jgi:hypothetical protein
LTYNDRSYAVSYGVPHGAWQHATHKENRHSPAWLAFAALFLSISVPAGASDVINPGGGTFAQIVDGGGTHTTITLVNLDAVPVPFTLSFFADDGSPLYLATTAGTNAVYSGVLPVGGSTIVQSSGGGEAITQGYATVTARDAACAGYGAGDGNCQIGGSAVFGITLNGQLLEATAPLDTGAANILSIPFDANSANTGIAIANSVGDNPLQLDGPQSANLVITFYDQSGANFYSTTMSLPNGQHVSFSLASQFPQAAGKTGIVVLRSLDSILNPYYIKAIGFRTNLAGTTYTSIAPLIPCNWRPNVGCQQF